MKDTITPKEGEEVLMHLRKSIFVMWRQMLVFIATVAASILLLTVLYKYPAAAIVAAALLLVVLGYAFYYFLIWYYDVFTITNMRILIFAKKGLFHREFSEVSYLDIIDVSYVVKGIGATVFQYGNVVLGLGNGQKVELTTVSTPGVVQETIKNLIDVTRRGKS